MPSDGSPRPNGAPRPDGSPRPNGSGTTNPSAPAGGAAPGPCVFCGIVAGEGAAHVVLDAGGVLAFLDIHPLFKGHTLVIPREHHVTLPDLPAEQIATFWSAVQQISAAIPAALGAHGTFVAMNNIVSQSVPHLHAHVVPRRRKDGLRGFFWPRQRYAQGEAAEYAARIAAALR